jgi:hypothetical protein
MQRRARPLPHRRFGNRTPSSSALIVVAGAGSAARQARRNVPLSRFVYARLSPAIAYSRVDTGRNPSAVPSSSKFPASHSRLGHGLIAQSYRPFSSSPLGRPTRLPGQAIFLPVATTMQNLNERDCHAKFNSQPCAQRYNLDDERNRSSSGSSSQRSLGSYSRAAFG